MIPTRAGNVSEDLAGGWLTFESGEQRLRFYPLPEQWDLLRDWQLERLRRAAVPVAKTQR
ncbi:MAG TPA: hypothetical protein VFQ45_20680 [Longimicrobium sp.]|nr:hypothetical protein [Longimicrobium sp.]